MPMATTENDLVQSHVSILHQQSGVFVPISEPLPKDCTEVCISSARSWFVPFQLDDTVVTDITVQRTHLPLPTRRIHVRDQTKPPILRPPTPTAVKRIIDERTETVRTHNVLWGTGITTVVKKKKNQSPQTIQPGNTMPVRRVVARDQGLAPTPPTNPRSASSLVCAPHRNLVAEVASSNMLNTFENGLLIQQVKSDK
jgi:hypothetical protein